MKEPRVVRRTHLLKNVHPFTVLPKPFDRLYAPSKLTEFDEYFSHSWATPSRKNTLVVRNKSPMFGVPGAIATGISVIGAVGATTPGARSSPSSDDQNNTINQVRFRVRREAKAGDASNH